MRIDAELFARESVECGGLTLHQPAGNFFGMRLAESFRLIDQRELFSQKPVLLLDLARLYVATGNYAQAADCYRLLISKGQPVAETAGPRT